MSSESNLGTRGDTFDDVNDTDVDDSYDDPDKDDIGATDSPSIKDLLSSIAHTRTRTRTLFCT